MLKKIKELKRQRQLICGMKRQLTTTYIKNSGLSA
tara:strand:+ start:305 stop:409 length:105 start_codon:yes stop_codon:yes gene_type:complete